MNIREGALGYHRLRDGDVCAVCLKSTPCEVEQALDLHADRAEISVIDAMTQRARAVDAEAALALLFAESSTAIAAAMDRADAAEAALVYASAGWAAAGDDAWERCIERDAAMADAKALAEALHECLMCWTPDAPRKREWMDAALAAHEKLVAS